MPLASHQSPDTPPGQAVAHVAIYDKSSAGIASAALDARIQRLILLHRKGDDSTGLQRVMRDRGIACDLWEASFEPDRLRQTLDKILSKYKDLALQFNASSGYRLMTVLALEYFRAQQLPSFVIDKYRDQWHWIFPEQRPSHHLSHRLKIHEYLSIFNARVTSAGHRQPESRRSRALTQWLVDHVESLSDPLAALNHIAMRANADHRRTLEKHQWQNPALQSLLHRFEAAGLLRIESHTVDFLNEENRFYANGGWLENHVFAVIYGLRQHLPAIQDVVRGLQISRGNDNVQNELDVTALSHNRLHIIECKTRRFSHRKDAGAPGASAVYRLGSLKELLGGLSAKAMLISYQPLSRYTEQRASDLGIFHCAHEQLHRLPFHLQTFFERDKPVARKRRGKKHH
jgi:hypothetical protein